MFIPFEGIENARELGGLTRADGARIRSNVLLRTGKLETATDEDLRRLAEMGVAHVVDFRDIREVEEHPDRPLPGAEHHHLPALGNLQSLFKKRPDDPTMTAGEIHRDFTQLYQFLARSPESQDAYEAFFRVLLESGGKPVLWHCTQGKDRTGVAGMLLLIALGFEEEQAIAEFMLTNRFSQKQLEELRERGLSEEEITFMKEILLVFEENARYYLRCLQMEYGTVPGFLELVLGVGPKEIETLEKYYLE